MLNSDYRQFLTGLGLYYHEVALESGERFNTNCALDFIVVERGKLREVSPESTWYLRGSGCGVNNLFSSEENLCAWLKEHPGLAKSEAGSVARVFS